MPKHKQTDRPATKKLSLRSSIVAQVDAALVDPSAKKPEYGSWSELIEALLEGWLDGRFIIHKASYSHDMKDLL